MPRDAATPSGALVVIPARFASTRLPAKLLLAETGKPLVVHTADRAAAASHVGRVVVATDDDRIAEAVRAHGYEAVMTSPSCASGTDRVAEVARDSDADVVVNVQGDEPEVDPGLIDALIDATEADPSADLFTASVPFEDVAQADDPAAVKVVVDSSGRALYFSRARIPFHRDADAVPPERRHDAIAPRLHVGIYAFRRPALLEFAEWTPSALERTEGLEQLRALDNGMAIHVVAWHAGHAGIDTREDYDLFMARHGCVRAGASEREDA